MAKGASSEHVVLAIDPGSKSGAAVMHGGQLIQSWALKLDDIEQRAAVVQTAIGTAIALNLPLMAILERWRGGGKWGTRAIAGTGASYGVWRDELIRAGYPKSRITTVYPTEWRGRVFGFAAGRSSNEWKRIAVEYVQARFDVTLKADEAEAVCIALWGVDADKVLKRVPKIRARSR